MFCFVLGKTSSAEGANFESVYVLCRNHNSSPVAIPSKLRSSWNWSMSRRILDSLTRNPFWSCDTACGTHFRVYFLSPSSRLRISFMVEGEMLKCIDSALVLAKGCFSRNLLWMSPKIVSDLAGWGWSLHDKSPVLNFRGHCFTIALDRTESWKVLSSYPVVFLFSHPFKWKYLTMNLWSNSSMTVC
jgi:hypothetical protein